ncbi:hypothetical protein EDD11_004148 [Mortierella claussenii]|nr:hypothetical protein EDD11_004148 [Mortierella claussenii]
MAVGPNIMPVLEQLGIAGLVASISMPCPSIELYDQKLKKLGTLPMKGLTDSLYEVLRSQLNQDNIIFHKKILSFEENELGVNVCCSDNSTYCGDILVGADGTDSRVRQSLHKVLARKNLLTRSDAQPPTPEYVCVAGMANQLSVDQYECLKDPYTHFSSVIGPKGQGYHTVNIPDDRICWAMWMELDPTTVATEKNTETSEFGPQNTEPIAKCFRDLPSPCGGSMGDLMNATQESVISRVLVEQKLYDTWYHGRTVLLGDAETNEFLDAVVLANAIYELRDLSMRSITHAFKDYYQQRFPYIREQCTNSRQMTKLFCGYSMKERLTRYLILNWLPHSYHERLIEETGVYRPQANFMKHIENRGRMSVMPHPSVEQVSEKEVYKRVSTVWGQRKPM